MKLSLSSIKLVVLALGLVRGLAQPVPGTGAANAVGATNEWVDSDEAAASNFVAQIEELARANGLLPANPAVTNSSVFTNAPASTNVLLLTNPPVVLQAPVVTNNFARSNAAAVMALAAQVSSNPPPAQSGVSEGRSRSSRETGTKSAAASSRRSGNSGSERSSRASRTEFTAFRIISDRNIFDPNRRANRPDAPRPKPKSVDSFSLVGVMSYEKGSFAFFDGSSSSFRKALKNSDSIAGFKVSEISANRVKLTADTNTFELQVGMQMRREEEGSWQPSRQNETYAAVSSPSPSPSPSSGNNSAAPPATSSGAESDVLKRLMQRREQE
jgi:hypothetical protein